MLAVHTAQRCRMRSEEPSWMAWLEGQKCTLLHCSVPQLPAEMNHRCCHHHRRLAAIAAGCSTRRTPAPLPPLARRGGLVRSAACPTPPQGPPAAPSCCRARWGCCFMPGWDSTATAAAHTDFPDKQCRLQSAPLGSCSCGIHPGCPCPDPSLLPCVVPFSAVQMMADVLGEVQELEEANSKLKAE